MKKEVKKTGIWNRKIWTLYLPGALLAMIIAAGFGQDWNFSLSVWVKFSLLAIWCTVSLLDFFDNKVSQDD